MARRLRILFRVAAGPRVGYGHVVRAGRLAAALGARAALSVRRGGAVHAPMSGLGRAPAGLGALDSISPDLLVLDTPDSRDAARWLAAARRRGIPVASVHDLGIAPVDSDLVVDGSLVPGRVSRSGVQLLGPRYAVVDPRVARTARRPDPHRLTVLVALGGGSRRTVAGRIAEAILRRSPDLRVVVAGGFLRAGSADGTDRIQWLGPQDGLSRQLARANVAVVAGGVTLYEAAALGVPAVCVAVVPAQRPTVAAFGRVGAAVDPRVTLGEGRRLDRASARRVAGAVDGLLNDHRRCLALGEKARRLVDGHGAPRVARALRALASSRRAA